MDIEGAVKKLLVANAAVAALVNTRIYPAALPEEVTYPAVSFFEISDVAMQTTDGPNGISTTRVQIDSWSPRRSESVKVADAVFAALCPYQPTDRPVGHRIVATLDDGTRIEIQGVAPDVRRSQYESDTKLYRRGRDYIVTAALAA